MTAYKNDASRDQEFADGEVKKINEQKTKKHSRVNYELEDEDLEQLEGLPEGRDTVRIEREASKARNNEIEPRKKKVKRG